MDHPDFRLRGGKIFATLAYPDKKWGMVKLTPEQQEEFVRAKPKVFVPVRGGWGRSGATSVLLRRPGLLRGAVLLSPMVPFEPEAPPDLTGMSVFIGAGRADPIAPPAQVEHLADLLRRGGAAVTVHWQSGGHALTDGEIDAARQWLWQLVAARQVERSRA